MTIYQVRDSFGNKLLEREDPAEVRHFIRTRTHYAPREVWILKDQPGELAGITPADDFIHLNPDYDDPTPDQY